MRNALAVIMALCVGSFVVGCSSKTPAPPAENNRVNPPQDTRSPGWTLKFLSRCQEGISPDQCVGAFGFSVMMDGKYQVGPGPKGEVRTGTLSAEELNSVRTALESTLDVPTVETLSHETIESTESSDVVTLAQGSGAPELLVKTEGTDLSFQTKSAAMAKAIHSAIRTLAVKYYSLPFPDACADGAVTVEALFATMKTCEKSSDCIYVSESFEPIEASSSLKLTTDDCSLIRPLAIANGSAVLSNKTKLQDAFEQVRSACGGAMTRPNCTNITEIQLSGTPPTCEQGVCQAPTH